MTTLETSPTRPGSIRPLRSATDALARATNHLLGLQEPGGWWKAELQTNVTMDAEDLFLRYFLDILEPGRAAATARWIRNNQRADGTWGTYFGSPPDLSTTIEAYVALRLAGDQPAEPHMHSAAEWVRAHGGVSASRVFSRIWLAALGSWSWDELPVLPPEVMFLPAWAPLNIYDFACWARQTIVALTVVMSLRPSRALPFDLDELTSADPAGDAGRPAPAPSMLTRPGRFAALDRFLHRYERLPKWVWPRNALRSAALRRAEEWIIRRQEADGLWGGIQPPVVYSIMALHLRGYPLDHPIIQAALRGLDGFTIEDEQGRRIEACQSPVWDTALALVALGDAGIMPDHPAVEASVDWLLGQEIRIRGDWAVRRPGMSPSGWAFEFANDNYPDIDDTAEVVLALRRLYPEGAGAEGSSGHAGQVARRAAVDDSCRRAVDWTVGMQSTSGGWGAFDADNDSSLVASLPFCDFGEVTDPPSADVTAHVVEMLAAVSGFATDQLERAVEWLWAEQEPDGSWFGRWGVNYIYGTGAAVPALMAAGADPDDPRIGRAVSWLVSHQNPDGGWGEDIRSYADPGQRGRGTSTASQTAWALLALLSAGRTGHGAGPAVERGVAWLVETQTAEGTWDEPQYTGTGFPSDFSINYHLYRLVWPVMALGRYARERAQR